MKYSISVLLMLAVTAFDPIAGGTCPRGWKPMDEYCYLVEVQHRTWSDAQAHCIEKGGDLVKITSQAENNFVLALVKEASSALKQVWIGLKWDTASNAFYWSDNSVPSYTNWGPNEPNGKAEEPCGQMWTGYETGSLPGRASGYWNDLPCGVVPGIPCGSVCKKLQ